MKHLIIGDPHAHFQHHNRRAEWIGAYIAEVKPDVVINMGDTWDMPSLSGFDKGTRAAIGRTYRQDIDAGLDFNERLWNEVKKTKKKLPRRVILIGNHEQRINKAINLQPELDGAIGFRDLELERNYDDIVEYNGRSPGVITIDGIAYSHFFISGVMGKPIGGTHAAYSILQKGHCSSTAGDLHLLSYDVQTGTNGRRIHGLVAGCAQDYSAEWAGDANKLWWRGIIEKDNVYDGHYDPRFLSLDSLKKQYG